MEVATGVPRINASLYKVTLDAANEEPLRTVAPSFGFSVTSGHLGHGEDIGQGAFAWVHSRRTYEGLQVSSQRLVAYNTLFQQYNNDIALDAATRTYGVQQVPIAPDTSGDLAQPALPAVSSLTVGGLQRTTGSKAFSISPSDTILMQGSTLDSGGAVQLVYASSGTATSGYKTAELTPTVRTNNRIEATVPEGVTGYCFGFNVGGNTVARFISTEQNGGEVDENPFG